MTENLNLGEYPKRRIDYLVEELGFFETPDMKELRLVAIAAMSPNGEIVVEPSVEYLQRGELIVDQLQREDKNRASVGLNLARALMYRDAGRADQYTKCIDDLLDDVYNLLDAGFDELRGISLVLEDELQSQIVDRWQ